MDLSVHCDACDHDRLVAFSRKGRGFCPSCGGRRMADIADPSSTGPLASGSGGRRKMSEGSVSA